MKYHLTYDFGSGSVKAALSDQNYSLCGIENVPYETYFPQFGQAEQKPLEHWQAMCCATHRLLEKTNVRAEDILGIAMAQTATTIIFVDREGNPLTDCVMWMDGRAEKQAEELNRKLGKKVYGGKNVLAKLVWFMENRPEIIEKSACMLDVSGWLFHRMTGEWAYEFTGSRATGLVDIENRCWDEKMFQLSGFPRRLVPERIASSTDQIGTLTKEAAVQLKLKEGIPLFGGCSDHAAAMLGTGCIRPGDAHIYIGTSAWLASAATEGDGVPGRMPSPVPGLRYHFYDTDSGGSCIEFLIRNFYDRELADGKDVYLILEEEVNQALSEEQEKVLFLPFLAGASAPISNTTVRASLLNLTRSTKRRHIALAVMQGICFNLRWMKEIHQEKNEWRPNFLRGIGGGMGSSELVQMLADVLDTPFTPLENPRFAGNLGLQTCIDLGLDNKKDFTILDRIVKCGKTRYPRPTYREKHDRMYQFYRESYESLEAMYKKLNQ
ncbi:MAG: xylulokinase [Ruminococcus sp.]|jgi:xylulokinase